MKRMLAAALAVMLCLFSLTALAAPGDAVPFRQGGSGISVQAAEVKDGAVYATDGSRIYRWRPGEKQPTELAFDGPAQGQNINGLVESGGQLYALAYIWGAQELTAQLSPLTVDGDQVTPGEPLTLDWSRMMIGSGGQSFPRSFGDMIVLSGRLYLLAMSENWQDTELMSFSLEDGSCQSVNVGDELWSIAPYRDGKFLAQLKKGSPWSSPVRVGVLDPATGKVDQIIDVKDATIEQFSGLAWDAQTDTIYYASGGQVHAMKGLDLATARPVNDMPLGMNGNLARRGLLLGGKLYACYNYNAMAVRNIDPLAAASRTLTLKGYVQPDDAYYAFTAAHPDVSVVLGSNFESTQDLVQAIMSQDESADIYLLQVMDAGYSALTGKGYAVELTDPALLAAAGRMYPAIKDALSANGKLVGVPSGNGYGGNALRYNSEVLKKLKLTEDDLPGTWAGLIEFVSRWEERFGTDFPELTPFDEWSMPNLREMLLNMLFFDYLIHMQASGSERFDSEALRNTLKALDAAGFEGVEGDAPAVATMIFGGESKALFSTGQNGISNWGSQADVAWPLSFAEGEPPVVGLSLAAYVINPYSKNKDIAEAYLRACAENLPAPARVTFCPDENEPVRPEYYPMYKRDMQREIEKLQKEIDAAAPADKQVYEEQLAAQKKRFEEFEANTWAATPTQIARYRKLAEHLVVPKFFGVSEQNVDEVKSLFDRYLGRQLPMDQFISAMEQKLRMMKMEGY